MSKNVVIIGSTGLLGQALIIAADNNGYNTTGIARKNADINIDATNEDNLISSLEKIKPKIIINSAAIVNLSECEKHPNLAMKVNAKISKTLAKYCQENQIKYVFISTDHYYADDRDTLHNESDDLNLINQYAITKRQGEIFALENKNSLVVRTNIVGFRYQENNHTFVEWALNSLKSGKFIDLYTDFYTSSIDVKNFSTLLLKLINLDATGIFNLASSDVTNKSTFIMALASKLKLSTDNTRDCKMLEIPGSIDRNESLGLDVSKAEKKLNQKMPGFEDVISSLAREYMENN